MSMPKIMLSVDPETLEVLKKKAKDRGVTVQQFIRVMIIGEWLLNEKHAPGKKE